MQTVVAHILDPSGGGGWWIVAALAIALALAVEHHVVAGFDRAQLRRRAQLTLGVAVVVALMVTVAPALNAQSSGTQPSGAQLPDLISDPPRPSFFTELNTPEGGTRLVVTFDGYVHNIGEGPLDVVGNPQEIDGMQQRVRNGDSWEVVGNPTVRFETDDGHNHFHLISAVEYVLWNELQGAEAAIGSKIGFCLVDTEQLEPGFDQEYSEDLDNFCQENNPGATELRMGISPGWRDVYDATTTLQWVDVSNTPPGRYWIGAITDPHDEIVESNESNNDLIFSEHTISVPGFSPRRQPTVVVDDAVVELTLMSTAHSTVTAPVYVIEQGPSSGVLDVPIGADLTAPTVRYFPDQGFAGTDEIVFSVHDAASPYPFDHPTQTIELQVAAGAGGSGSSGGSGAGEERPPSLVAASSFFESNVDEAFSIQVEAIDAAAGTARLFATGLPTGVVADTNGTISGVPVEAGIFDVTLMAIGATSRTVTTLDVSWIVNDAAASGAITSVADQSSPLGEPTRLRIGTNVLGLVLEADGLPPGIEIRPGSTLLEGVPSEVGTYDVVVREIDDGTVAAETTFTWTIRPSATIDFVF